MKVRNIEINLFGVPLMLGPRSVSDIIDASVFSKENKNEIEANLYVNAFVVHCGLKESLRKFPEYIPFYKFRLKAEYKKIKKMISVQNIMTLKLDQVIELADKVAELDFGKVEKKKHRVL